MIDADCPVTHMVIDSERHIEEDGKQGSMEHLPVSHIEPFSKYVEYSTHPEMLEVAIHIGSEAALKKDTGKAYNVRIFVCGTEKLSAAKEGTEELSFTKMGDMRW